MLKPKNRKKYTKRKKKDKGKCGVESMLILLDPISFVPLRKGDFGANPENMAIFKSSSKSSGRKGPLAFTI